MVADDRTRRAAAGVVVLLAVALIVPVVGRLSQPGVPGRPVADWPPAPSVGHCLGLPGGDPGVVVPCDRPHLQEVTVSFGATDPRNPDVLARWDDYCADPAADYLGIQPVTPDVSEHPPDPVPAWTPPTPAYTFNIARAPERDRVGGLGWVACIVRPQGRVPYTGSARDAGRSIDRPGAFGVCGNGDDGADIGYTGVSCTGPHQWEVLGQASVSEWRFDDDLQLVPVDPPPNWVALRRTCGDLAARALGVSDPSHGGLLTVDVAPVSYLTACIIAPTDPAAVLTDSLVGWGDRPPPLAAG